jgi:hypothetical protein
MQAGVIELGRHTFQRRGIGAGQREPAGVAFRTARYLATRSKGRCPPGPIARLLRKTD